MVEKVLIVDDDTQTLRLVGLMLERQGYKVVAANNGFQGVRSARVEQPSAILLDVMMPDMDGYEVTRLLRKNPETAHIPILMFTARSETEDKISGYEAGVDDYLTKPIHPAELIAHLRAVLARRPNAPTATSDQDRGYVIGFLAAKGGLGVSTLALNLGISLFQKAKRDVIAAELRPGQGTWSTELALNHADGLSHLLNMRAADITPSDVEKELVRLPYGIRLLAASPHFKDSGLMANTSQYEQIIDSLSLLSRLVLLDIGTTFFPGVNTILDDCDEVIVVTDPFPSTVHRTRALIDELYNYGFSKHKPITVVSVNRARVDVQISLLQMQEILRLPVAQVIPPVPEAAYQAATRCVPIYQVPTSNLFVQQIQNLAQMISERVPA